MQDSNIVESTEHNLLEPLPSRLSAAIAAYTSDAASQRTSTSIRDVEAGFARIDGDIGGSGYNETRVDIVTVPCPGADPIETWTRDPLPDGYFGLPLDSELASHPTLKEFAGDTILSPGLGGNFPKAAHLWVRQGIRRYVSTARILLYRHRELLESVSLDLLAKDLLKNLLLTRDAVQRSRPIFFIAHSVGGLVVKKALLMASTDDRYRAILYNCHGISFFATPHRGSSYMSSSNLSHSIQQLLHLQRPFPRSIAREIHVNNKNLLKMHEAFTDIASEIRIWTFYETIDSQLSGLGTGVASDVSFSAPLVSIKSALVSVRQEVIYSSLESDHAHCASFGPENPRTLAIHLHDLAAAVTKAEGLSETIHTPLKLKEQVRVEIFGFYADPDVAPLEAEVRPYVTKYQLSEFLQKGPERCLAERLGRASKRSSHRRSVSASKQDRGIVENIRRFVSSTLSSPSSEQQRDHVESPDIIVTPAAIMPPHAGLPAPPGKRSHSLTMPVPMSPGFERPSSRGSDGAATTASEPTGHEHLPKDHSLSDLPVRNHKYHTSDSDHVGLGIASGTFEEPKKNMAAALQQDLGTGFSRPNSDQRKFMWIHVPFTNPLWVRDIFNTLSETHKQDFSRLFSNEHWVSRHVQGRHSQSQPSFVKPAVNLISTDASASSPRPPPSPTHSASSSQSAGVALISPCPKYLYLYLPYLHFDTYKHILQRRNLISRRLAHGRARPVPRDIAALESLEFRVLWEYLGHDPPLNGRRTLDQYGYPSLRDTHARDDDQMLYKLTKENERRPPPPVPLFGGGEDNDDVHGHDDGTGLPQQQWVGGAATWTSGRYSAGTKMLHETIAREKDNAMQPDGESEALRGLRNGNLLMVDQLWLWAIDYTTLTTFFPKRESRPSEGALFQQADLRNSVYHELNGDLTGRCENALDLAAFVALHAVTVLLDRSSHPDLEVFRIFEEAIGLLTEGMTTNLRKYRMQTFKDVEVESDSDPEDNTAASIKKRHKREIERAEQENRENTSALLELRDMEDELKTLQRLFDTQVNVIGKMLDIYMSDNLKDVTHYGQAYLNEALGRLIEYKAQAAEMLERAAATRGDYEKLLEMAQRQAQVDDVRWSRLQTELASSQNLSVMIFTIFTVIFLPLSFFTSLFGMNTLEWGGSDNEYPTLGFIGAISLPASLVMIGATLVAAFSSHVQVVSKAAFRRVHLAWEAGLGLLQRLEPEDSRRDKERRLAAKEREVKKERQRRRTERAYDYWATVRRQRTLGTEEMADT